METLRIYEIGSIQFATHNDSFLVISNKSVVTLIETKFMNDKSFHVNTSVDTTTSCGGHADIRDAIK